MIFLCVTRCIAWSEEETQNFHLFGDFLNPEDAQDFEAQICYFWVQEIKNQQAV